MTPDRLHFAVPGPLEQRTGGYLYDARIVSGLRDLGWRVEVHNLEGSFPDGDRVARRALEETLAGLPDGARVVIDGLGMGGIPEPVEAHAPRLRIVSLVHHALADETGLDARRRARLHEAERAALAPCRGVIVTSEYTALRLTELYSVAPRRIRAIPPGTRPASAARGPGADETPCLLCVGTVTPRKGHEVLVGALARVRDLDWRCVCAGSLERDPRHVDLVRRRIEEAGLTGRVTLIGEQGAEALDTLYDGASIFVLASFFEGYGMALAEALARGLPVVSTRGGAIPFTVPEEAGLLVDPGDDVALARALRSVLDPASGLGPGLAAAARRHARALPTWEDSARLFAEAVRELAP